MSTFNKNDQDKREIYKASHEITDNTEQQSNLVDTECNTSNCISVDTTFLTNKCHDNLNEKYEDFSDFSSDQISDCGDDDYNSHDDDSADEDENEKDNFMYYDEEEDESEEVDSYNSDDDGEFVIGSKRSKKRPIKTAKKPKTQQKRSFTSAFGKSRRPSIKFKTKKKKSRVYGGFDYGDTTTEEESFTEEDYNEDDLFYKYEPNDDDNSENIDNDSLKSSVFNKKLDINKLSIECKTVDRNYLSSTAITIDKIINYKFGSEFFIGKKWYRFDANLVNDLDSRCNKYDNYPAVKTDGDGETFHIINKDWNDTNKLDSVKIKKEEIDEIAPDIKKQVLLFLIKWKNKSYLHCTWESEKSLRELGITNNKKLQNYCQENNIDPNCTVDPLSLMDEHSQSIMNDKKQSIDSCLEEFTKLNCILSISPSNVASEQYSLFESTSSFNKDELTADGVYVLCQWNNLSFSEATWESASLINSLFPNAIHDYFVKRSKMYYQFDLRRMGSIKFYKVNSTPDFIKHCNCVAQSEEKIEKKNKHDNLPLSHTGAILDETSSNETSNQNASLAHTTKDPIHEACNILRDYQLEGVNWITNSFCRKKSVILADEMGLGKTVQVISFISTLFHTYHINGPYLIVVPLSTIESWKNHFQKWAPELNVICYTGNADSRRVMRRYNFFDHDEDNNNNIDILDNLGNDQNDSNKFDEFNVYNVQLKFHVFVTTYEMILKDKEFIGQFDWVSLIVDEAHRLKNIDSALYMTLQSFYSSHRLLMTGTPLQNNLRELWCILHFILPDRYPSWEDFEMNFSQVDPNSGYMKLQKEISPYILRRMKKDVEKSLPPKIEQILRVEMTKRQKDLYKCILTKNYIQLSKELKCNITGFLNVMMELKKCCNHTNLITHHDLHNCSLNDILRGSGKMILLDKLLVRFKKDGNRVLIFSQMIMILDILSAYLTMKGYSFQRLDGSVSEAKRKQAMNEFNAKDSKDFCFLLSTRAGGLGINLVSADVVIIFDSDWNPQNDLQAQARAHRIGQTKTVKIYRLVTKGSVDETIVERAKKKMVLDHLVIQTMSGIDGNLLSSSQKSNSIASNLDKKDLSSIIKFGAEELFKEDDDDNDDKLQRMDIDTILSLAEEHDGEQQLSTSNANNASEELLSSFKVANFKTSDFDVDDEENNDKSSSDNDPTWDDIIPEKERKRIIEEEEIVRMAQLYLPPRRRNTTPMIDYYNNNNSGIKNVKPLSRKKSRRISTRKFSERFSHESSDFDAIDTSSDEIKSKPFRKKGKLAQFVTEFDGLNEQDIKKFVNSYKKFPSAWERYEVVAKDAGLSNKPIKQVQQLAKWIHSILPKANPKSSTTKTSRSNKLTINQIQINSSDLYEWEQSTKCLANHIKSLVSFRKPQFTSIKLSALSIDLFKELYPSVESCFNYCNFSKFSFSNISWTSKLDSELLIGVFFVGFSNWKAMFNHNLLKELEECNLSNSMISKKMKVRLQDILKVLSVTKFSSDNLECKSASYHTSIDNDKSESEDLDLGVSNQNTENKNRSKPKKSKKDKNFVNEKVFTSFSQNPDDRSHKGNNELSSVKTRNKAKKVKTSVKSTLITQYMMASSKSESLKNDIVSPRAKDTDKLAEITLTDKMVDSCGSILKPVKDAISKLQNIFKGRIFDEVSSLSDFKNCIATIGDCIDFSTDKHQLSIKYLKIFKTAHYMRCALWNFVSRFTNATPSQLYTFYNDSTID